MAFKKHSAPTKGDELESSFFQLSYNLLQDKCKALLPYLIGFEIKDKTDDGTKALGMFGFRGDEGQILFVPVFFVNGSVKGLDILYSRDSEQFYPLNEDFVEMLIGKDNQQAGAKSNESRQSVMADNSTNGILDMVRPPRTGKYTYASSDEFPTLLEMIEKHDRNIKYSCLDFIKNSDNFVKKSFDSLLSRNSDFLETLLRYHSVEKIAEALVPKVLPPKDKPGKEYRDADQVKLINEGETDKAKVLDEAEKQELATKGFVIVDKRPEEKKSKFAPVNLALSFANPSVSGFYPYLTQSGEIRYGLVLVKPEQLNLHFTLDDSIVVDLDADKKGKAYIVDTKKLFVKNLIVVQDYKDVYRGFENPSDVKPGFSEIYVLINENLKATQPFRIIANFKDSSGIRRLNVEPWQSYERTTLDNYGTKPLKTGERPGSVHSLPDGNYYNNPKKVSKQFLVMTKNVGDKFTIKGETTYVPAGYKLLKLDLTNVYDSNGGVDEDYVRGKPGGLDALNVALGERQVYPMTIHNNGSEYFVSVKDVQKRFKNDRMAKIGMVMDFGLGYKEACEVIDNIRPTYKVKGYLKVADTGAYPAQPIEEVPYINEFGTPTYQGYGTENVAPIDNYYDKDPTRMGLGVKPDVEGIDTEINKAIQMAQSGQKEVFDSHTIATMAKYVNPSDKITEYTPKLLDALDKLGRLLFLTHWEVDKFTQMYGRDDMPKFIELLTDVFRNLGDTIIFLKRKSPDLTINMGQQDALDV